MKRTSVIPLVAALALLSLANPARAQRQVAKVIASNAAPGDEFGYATAIDGDWAIIGARLNDDRAFQGGAAYVFHRTNGTWTQTQELLASDGAQSDLFGWSIAMSGDRAVVGALGGSAPFATHSGSVYVFERIGNSWVETAELVASNASNGAQFGDRVAISGDRIVVGSWYAARAYVFERVGASWLEVAILTSNDPLFGDSFGSAVAIDGDLVVVGAPLARINPPIAPGAAYVFARNSQGLWIQQQKLIASDGAHNDFFGDPVRISNDTIVIAAAFHDSDTGAGYVFDYNGTAWIQTQEISALDARQSDTFGLVAIQGSVALGAAGQDLDSGSSSGAGYAFIRVGSLWVQTGKLIPNDAKPGDVAARVALSGTTVIIGALGCDDACPQLPACNAGAAYFFELAPTAIQYGSCPTGAPCANADAHGGCRNSTGQGAILQASGSGSATTDDLIMEVRHLPPYAPGLLFMGGTKANTAFGSGRLVVGDSGSGIFRIEIHFAGVDGAFTHGPGTVALTQGIPNPLGHIQAGQTWDFQCWYRDAQSPCGIGYNLTNGLEVSFVP